MDPIIWARPERTQAEITASEADASQFFDSIRKRPQFERDFARLREHLSYDKKLRLAESEGSEWAARNNLTTAQRAARRTQAEAASSPRASELRDFGTSEARAELPPVAQRVLTTAQRTSSVTAANRWFKNLGEWDGVRINVAAQEAGRPFEHWLLEHPHYGIASGIEAAQPMVRIRPTYAYERGSIRPAGMTPERALEIALIVLDRKGGEWR